MSSALHKDPGLVAAIRAVGTVARLAEALRISSSAISQWRRVPLDRVRVVEEVTGVPAHVLRPDHFDAPRPSKAARRAARRCP
jgi:pyruvate kinase